MTLEEKDGGNTMSSVDSFMNLLLRNLQFQDLSASSYSFCPDVSRAIEIVVRLTMVYICQVYYCHCMFHDSIRVATLHTMRKEKHL